MTKEETINIFSSKMAQKLGKKYELHWDTDKKGVVCGWCKLANPEDIRAVAEIVAGFKGRVMTISPLITSKLEKPKDEEPKNEEPKQIEINYHFYFDGVNCTVSVTLPDGLKEIDSITPVLKSADWHEREMQELYNIKLKGHPNSKRLFLDDSIQMTDHTMIPLSEALNGASTNTLWEKIMKSNSKEANTGE